MRHVTQLFHDAILLARRAAARVSRRRQLQLGLNAPGPRRLSRALLRVVRRWRPGPRQCWCSCRCSCPGRLPGRVAEACSSRLLRGPAAAAAAACCAAAAACSSRAGGCIAELRQPTVQAACCRAPHGPWLPQQPVWKRG